MKKLLKKRYGLLLCFIFFVSFCFGQSYHFLMFGVNYPVAPSEPNMARGLGLDLGYQFTKPIKKYFSFNTGIRVGVFEKFEAKNTGVDIIVPVKFGITIGRTTLASGISLNVAGFYSFGKYDGQDPEMYPHVLYGYFDMNTERTFGVGFNFTLDYKLSKRNFVYFDFARLKLNDMYYDKKYSYGLLTVGLKRKLN